MHNMEKQILKIISPKFKDPYFLLHQNLKKKATWPFSVKRPFSVTSSAVEEDENPDGPFL